MILVTGATGHLGGAIIEHLLKKVPADQIAALVRNEEKAVRLKHLGVNIRIGNYHEAASLHNAFKGIRKAVLISSNDFNDRLAQHKKVVDAAKAAGVVHIIYTGASMKDIETSVLRNFMIDHFQTEEYIQQTGMAYTFMRHNLYAEMIPLYIGRDALDKGIIFPAGEGAIPFALRDEMGEAISNILMLDGHENKIYNIANVVSYSFQDIAAMLSRLSGKSIEYQQCDDKTYMQTLQARGIPEHMARIAIGFATAMCNNDFNVPGDDLKNLLDRLPSGLEVFLKKNYMR